MANESLFGLPEMLGTYSGEGKVGHVESNTAMVERAVLVKTLRRNPRTIMCDRNYAHAITRVNE